MKCDGCKKNEANVVLHMITNGQVATRSLCMDCARKAHGEMSQAFATMGLAMSGLEDMRTAADQQAAELIRLPRMICSTCRTPYEDINHDTVFGCPQCYRAFHDQVIGYLSELRGPEAMVSAPAETEQRQHVVHVSADDLRQRLKDAIHDEDYEQAASLRDRLREIGTAEGTSDA